MAETFFTSDLHIGHRLVSKLRTGFDEATARKSENGDNYAIAEHDDRLARNWDATVKNDDIVWVVGDISIGGNRPTRAALNWLNARPGRKRLIKGNHEANHPMHRDAHKWEYEFAAVFEFTDTVATTRIDGNRVLISHFPYDGDHDYSGERYTEFRLRDTGVPLIHGHTHVSEKFSRSASGTPQIHVGVDAWDYTPVNVNVLAEMMENRW